MKTFQYEIVTRPTYRAIGLKWDGPWSEISALKSTIHRVSERVSELEYAVDPNIQLGLSYHLRPDGFVHYSVYEVTEDQEIPKGMIEMRVPEMTYVVTQHEKGESIGQTYDNISLWLADSDYNAYTEPGETYFDHLPIKHERYPIDRDQKDPHFEILIPVVKQS
ncbi:GyrI-like domain-containing protein [Evansella halocellulosilytica]|uniref:GyrI-like domain-containing protein n=1 Tax=Evansella halocellulosilytica TaxID=2011013 RepID=UPI000BB8A752|nr:GyrI-like domain-containing protein [Evansella halocellulosilytica]